MLQACSRIETKSRKFPSNHLTALSVLRTYKFAETNDTQIFFPSLFLCGLSLTGSISILHPSLSPMVFIITALRRIGRGTFSKLFDGFFFVGLMGWDFSLALVNLITFKRKVGRVTPKGLPGEGGVWPEYSPPREGDSRCSCPGLNAMANHGSLLFLFHFLFRHCR